MTLTAEKLRELLDYDPATGVFIWAVRSNQNTLAGTLAGTTKHSYFAISISSRVYAAHRLAWLYVHGVWPTYHIDHKDGDIRNNQITNLRDVPRNVNMQNRRKAQINNRSGLQGAMKNGSGWMSRIAANGVIHYLGNFQTPEEAHQAYLKAKRRLHEGCTI